MIFALSAERWAFRRQHYPNTTAPAANIIRNTTMMNFANWYGCGLARRSSASVTRLMKTEDLRLRRRSPISPLLSQGRGQGEGFAYLQVCARTPHLSPLPLRNGHSSSAARLRDYETTPTISQASRIRPSDVGTILAAQFPRPQCFHNSFA